MQNILYILQCINFLNCYSIVGANCFITSFRGLSYITLLSTAEIWEGGSVSSGAAKQLKGHCSPH